MSNENIKSGLNGLKNIGNTCYMNSIIQILSSCKDIRNYFLDNNHINIIINKNKEIEINKYLCYQIGKVIHNLWNGTKEYIPNEFKFIFGQKIELFQGSEQQDSLEALLCILNTMHNEIELPIDIIFNEKINNTNYILDKNYDGNDKIIKSLRSFYSEIKNNSIIKEKFLGLQHSKISCTHCNNCSHTFDPILTLTLSFPDIVPKKIQENKSIINKNIYKEKIKNLDELNNKITSKWYDNFHKINKSKFKLNSSSDDLNEEDILEKSLSGSTISNFDVTTLDDLNEEDINFLEDESNEPIENINDLDNNLTLNDLLEHQSMPELLNDKNQWHCDKCNNKVNAYKIMNFWYLPEIIVIHLKRFQKTYTSIQKITDKVIFPINNLDLNNFIDDDSPLKNKNIKYELFAINNHDSLNIQKIPHQLLEKMTNEQQIKIKTIMMSGIDFGHYYSYCKHENGKWYEYNDENVKEINENDIITDKAYLLFYHLINNDN
jgi:ubiquitin C-terminal hydrolase